MEKEAVTKSLSQPLKSHFWQFFADLQGTLLIVRIFFSGKSDSSGFYSADIYKISEKSQQSVA